MDRAEDRQHPSAWGHNAYGQVGNTTTTDAHSPVTVSGFDRGESFYKRGSASRASYAYNGEGLRVPRTEARRARRWAGTAPRGSRCCSPIAPTARCTGPGGLPLEQVDASDNVLYFHHNRAAPPRMLSDASGKVAATLQLRRLRTVTAATGAASTPFRYAGEYTDAETGFVYLRARYYDPGTGQFISRDPFVAITRSPYGYVYDNPLNSTDPLGLSSCGQFSLGGLVDCGAKAGRNAAVTAKIAAGAAAAAITPTPEAGVNAAADAVDSVGRRIPGALEKAAGWTGDCLAVYCVSHPLEGLTAVVALGAFSALAIYGGALACTTVLGCIVGAPVIAAGIAGIGATGYLAYQEVRHWRSFLPTVEAAAADTWCPQ